MSGHRAIMEAENSRQYDEWMNCLAALPMVALVTTGRTGSDFLQSLLDSHPQVLTFNGHFAVYSEFFLTSRVMNSQLGQVEDVADEFIGQYLYKLVSCYEVQEAKDRLGENSDQSFRIDTAEFKRHVVGLMEGRVFTTRNLLLAIYGAYGLCLEQDLSVVRLIFHHPHLEHELRVFLKDFPESRLVFTTRDPRANFCSHVEHFRRYYRTHDNEQHLFNCLQMALDDSALGEALSLDYVAVRLEDLPREDTMRALAAWLHIDYRESLLRSTWAGLDWHGDRISGKTFSATGWSETRTANGWERRLGRVEQHVLNFIMEQRLRAYGYPVRRTGMLDVLLVPLLIAFPFRYERRFLSPSYIWGVLNEGNGVMRLQFLLNPLYYFRRIGLCYRYYFRRVRHMLFVGKWIDVRQHNGVSK